MQNNWENMITSLVSAKYDNSFPKMNIRKQRDEYKVQLYAGAEGNAASIIMALSQQWPNKINKRLNVSISTETQLTEQPWLVLWIAVMWLTATSIHGEAMLLQFSTHAYLHHSFEL